MSEETGELRHYTGLRGIIVTAISVSLPCYVLVFNVLDVPFRMGFYFYPEAYNAVFLAISLVMLFLLVPGSRNDLKGLPWYDVLLIGASLLVTLYIFFKAETIALAMNIYTSSFEQVLGLIAFLVLCEAIRRTVGWPIILVTLIFLLHAKFAYLFPGLLGGPVYSWSRLAAYMYLYDTGIFGMITEIAGTIIIGFIVFGRLMIEVGAGKFLSDLALGLAGHFRGGAAKVAVVASAFFGMVSGSPLANVGTTGVITIPLMKKIGYKPEFAAAVESVASTGGMLTPPVMGAVAFIMADFTKITYGRICAAAILPAILYFFSLFVQIDFEALKIGSRGLPRNELPSLKKTIREGWHLMLPLIMLGIFLMFLNYEVLESLFYASLLLIGVSWFRKDTRIDIKRLVRTFEDGAKSMLMVTPLCALSGVIVGAIALTGLGVNLSALLIDISRGNLLMMAIFAWVVIYIMGMTVAVIITYILLAIMVAPAMVELNVPVLVAHMFIFYTSMSMFFTPPLCPTVYVAASMAQTSMFKAAFASMKLGIVCYIIPFVILFKPGLLMIGSPAQIASAAATTLFGCFILASAVSGYLQKRIYFSHRIFLSTGGVMVMFAYDWKFIILGLAIVLIAFLRHRRSGAEDRPQNT